MIRLFLALILALDTALFTTLLFLFLWRVRQRAIRRRAIDVALNLPYAVVIANQRDGVLAMNREAREMFATSRQAMKSSLDVSLPLFDRAGKSVQDKDHPLMRALRLKRSIEQTKLWVRAGENRLIPIAVSAAYISVVSDEPFAALLARDISREEIMETMRRDFIGIASHQMRSPLASLKWYGELLMRDALKDLKPEQKTYLTRMNDATARMIALVDDFLDTSQYEDDAQSSNVDRVRLRELVKHLIEVHRPLIQNKKLSVRISSHGKAKPVYADPAMLRETLANLVANAVKYNRPGGRVSITLNWLGDDVEMRVSDTGIGIPKDQQQRVFTKFFRAGNAVEQGHKGTGLGLYTAKLILEQMQGSIRFESEQEKGTTFWVRFPRDQRKRMKA